MEKILQVTSVNVGEKASLKVGNRETQTGIFKQPVDHPVEVKVLGITGDRVIDTRHHGGLDQAVYLYRQEDYDHWAAILGRDMPAGMFGENLTVSGLDSPGLDIGDRLVFANLELEITAPRIPCSTLAARMGSPSFVKKFVQEERPGLYARVIRAGTVQTGESFTLTAAPFASISTIQMYRDVMATLDEPTLSRYLSLPIDMRTKHDFEKRLAKLSSDQT